MTGNAVINYALTLHGITYVGQTPGSDALAMCQTAMNNMLAEWNAQGLAIFSIVRNQFALTNGKADYTIGTGQDLNTARPEKIEAWAVFSANGAQSGGKPVDAPTFASQADDRSATGAKIRLLNYDAAFPNGTIHLWPTPTGGTLELWVWEQMTAISDFTLDISFPPGYLKALSYNLALDLAPLFGRPIDQGVLMLANQTKATLGATNVSETTRMPQAQQPRQ